MAEDHTDRIRNMVFLTIPHFQITPTSIVCVSELKQLELEYCSRSAVCDLFGGQGCCTLKFLNEVV
jgi:hypothetical protein